MATILPKRSEISKFPSEPILAKSTCGKKIQLSFVMAFAFCAFSASSWLYYTTHSLGPLVMTAFFGTLSAIPATSLSGTFTVIKQEDRRFFSKSLFGGWREIEIDSIMRIKTNNYGAVIDFFDDVPSVQILATGKTFHIIMDSLIAMSKQRAAGRIFDHLDSNGLRIFPSPKQIILHAIYLVMAACCALMPWIGGIGTLASQRSRIAFIVILGPILVFMFGWILSNSIASYLRGLVINRNGIQTRSGKHATKWDDVKCISISKRVFGGHSASFITKSGKSVKFDEALIRDDIFATIYLNRHISQNSH